MSSVATEPVTNVGRKRKSPSTEDGLEDGLEATNEEPFSSSETCPYLDTIQRSTLDFDFEPACSVSMQSGPHIYGCLVCGKFFRGRGSQTPAYTHSVQDGHFVFVHLTTSKFYCLPDNYEIQDSSLQDIRNALHPSFTKEQVDRVDQNQQLARDLFGRRYLPGFVGLNNLNKTDGINAVVQALAHVPPLRDYFLQQTTSTTTTTTTIANSTDTVLDVSSSTTKTTSSTASHVVSAHRMSQHVTQCFGELVRKLWSDQRFKNHIDPHKLVQAVAVASHNRFRIGNQMEAGEFMAWFLHQLHMGLGGSLKRPGSSIIHKIFQGTISVTTRQVKQIKMDRDEDDHDQDDRQGSDDEEDKNEIAKSAATETPQQVLEETVDESHFLQLTLDISEKPVFRDDDGGLVIPQEPLVTVLKKFDGISFSDIVNKAGVAQRRRYQIRNLPPYLILHLARFQTNRFLKVKNPTIVAFPVKNLDLSDYVFSSDGNRAKKERVPTEEEVRAMSIKDLKALLIKHGRDDLLKGSVEKSELVQQTVDFVAKSLPDLLTDKYDLVANITHESPADVGREGQHDPLQDGSYKCHVQHRGTKQWYEIQDLHVQEIMPQLIGLSESYLLIFERKSAGTILAKTMSETDKKSKSKKSKKKRRTG